MKKKVNDFFSDYLLFSLLFSLGLWLFNFALFEGHFSSLFFSSVNLFFHFQLLYLESYKLLEEEFCFFETLLGQFVFLTLAICESGAPLLVISLVIPIYGALRLEGIYGYFPLLKVEENNDINKLFFHDLVNKTHGMKLFLKSRIDQKKEMSEEDLKELVKEVESLQLLIKDHFKEHHKNLESLEDYVSAEKALEGVKRLANYFLPEKDMSIVFENQLIQNEGFVHYPSFYRIFGNLIKNIADHKGYNIKVSFESKGEGLFVVVQNQFDSSAPPQDISRSFGIRSIEKNCLEQGGTFTFKVENKVWESEIWIPLHRREAS